MFDEILQIAQELASTKNLGDFSNPKLVIDPLNGSGYLESGGENPAKINFQIDLDNAEWDFEPQTQTENEADAEVKEEVKEEETTPNAESEETPTETALEETLKTTEDMATDEVPALEEKEKSQDMPPAEALDQKEKGSEPKAKPVLMPLGSKSLKTKSCS